MLVIKCMFLYDFSGIWTFSNMATYSNEDIVWPLQVKTNTMKTAKREQSYKVYC